MFLLLGRVEGGYKEIMLVKWAFSWFRGIERWVGRVLEKRIVENISFVRVEVLSWHKNPTTFQSTPHRYLTYARQHRQLQ